MNDWTVWLTWAIFATTYAGLALGKVPGLRMDRAGIALVGAILILVTGVLSLEQAVSTESIDFKTLFLLFGMMIVVGVLRLSGFLERLTGLALRRISTPKGLLAATIGLSGGLSAFLINDVVCVALTPLVLHLARRMKFDPIPHLIGLATAANVGSTGTITGNPQNIYIGAHSGISYLRFASKLLPVALLVLGLTYLVVSLVYRSRLAATQEGPMNNGEKPDENGHAKVSCSRVHARLQIKAVTVTLAAVALFFTGLPLLWDLVARSVPPLVVLLDRIKPEKDLPPGGLELAGDVYWIVHRRACFSGSRRRRLGRRGLVLASESSN